MKILSLNFLMLSCLVTSLLKAEEGKSQHLRLVGFVLPLSQVKLIEGQSIKIEASTNAKNPYENQKVFLTDSNTKKIINIKSSFTEDENGKVKQTILLNQARELRAEHKMLYFNVVSN